MCKRIAVRHHMMCVYACVWYNVCVRSVFACQYAGNAAATSPARGGGRLAASSPRSAIARLPSGASPSPGIPPPQAGSAKGGGIPRPAHSVSAEPRAWPEVRRTAGSGGFLRGAASACGAVCRRPARSEYLPSPDRRHLACLRPRLPPSPPPPRAAAPPARSARPWHGRGSRVPLKSVEVAHGTP